MVSQTKRQWIKAGQSGLIFRYILKISNVWVQAVNSFDVCTRPTGLALGGPERTDIHKLHRIIAGLTALIAITTGLLALRAGLRTTAIAVIAILVAEFSVGVAAILTNLPIGVAVAHNWLAAMLLLGLLRLLAESRNRQALL